MEAAANLIEKLTTKNPSAVQLAQLVSLALRIEIELLRNVRLALLPDSDAGAEADLWFSDLIESRNPAGIVLRRDVSDILRQGLAEDRPKMDAAWRFIEYAHKNISPAVFVEEKLAWLALSDEQQQMRQLLRSVVATMIQPHRAGLLDWAARAYARLPRAVKESEEGQMLAFGLSLRLEEPEGYDLSRAVDPPPFWAAWLTPSDVPMSRFGIRMVEGSVEFGNPGMQESHVIELPQTRPVLVELNWNQGRTPRMERVRLIPGNVSVVEIAPRIYVSQPRTASKNSGRKFLSRMRNFFGKENVILSRPAAEFVIGSDIRAKIASAVESCHVMIVLIDQSSFAPATADELGDQTEEAMEILQMEYQIGHQTGLQIVPVLLDGAQLPKESELTSETTLLAGLEPFIYEPESGQNVESLFADIQGNVELKTVLGQRYLLSSSFTTHKLRDVRAPRVNITYDVEIDGYVKAIELPFVVGVMTDLSGDQAEPLPPLRDRKFISIDRDNFGEIRGALKPRLAFSVNNRFADDESNLQIELRLASLDDFYPEYVAEQVPPLRKLLERRKSLFEIASLLDNRKELYDLFEEIVIVRKRAENFGGEIGAAAPETEAPTEMSAFKTEANAENQLQREAFEKKSLEKEQHLITEFITRAGHEADPVEPAKLKELIGEFVSQIKLGTGEGGENIQDLLYSRIARIDELLSSQLNEIMHHPDFQNLEASWRGLHYLVNSTETSETLQIRVLNASKQDLLEDLESASEFEDSILYNIIYKHEFGNFGGTPYGLLIGDYEIGRDTRDMTFIEKMSKIAAAAHAPFISAASPQLFGLDSFTQLSEPRDMAKIFQRAEFARWHSFRDSEDSRYVALVMPHILMRLPYGKAYLPVEAFDFEERVDGNDNSKYLWGNAAYALGTRVMDAFAKYHWCAAIRGVEGGGLVQGLPVHTFKTDKGDVAMKCPTEIAITDPREKELSDLGFIPLVHCKDTDYAAFFSTQTTNKPKLYGTDATSANARLSSQLQYILPVSRFAHYLKSMMRDKIGSFMGHKGAEVFFNRWISNYTLGDDAASQEMKAKHPLREAQVDVSDIPEKPGAYRAVAFLRPHFQLDELTVSLRIVVDLPVAVR